MTNKTDNYSRGDLVLLWDDVFDKDAHCDWDGYFIGVPKRMRLHGKVGIVLSRNDVFDDIYESQTYWIWVDDKREEVHKSYMRKVEK